MENPKKDYAPTSASSSTSAPYPRHVKFPFDLRDRSIEIKGEVLRALLTVFPGTTNFYESAARSYISFEVEQLPPGPWPLTVAGLPYTIGESKGSLGKGPMFPWSKPGNMTVRICQDLKIVSSSMFSASSFRDLADAVNRDLFTHAPDLAVVEIMLDAEMFFHVILRDDVDIRSVFRQLPGNIAGHWTRYLHEKDMRRPKPRTNEPFNQDGDDVWRLERLFGEVSDDKIDPQLEVSFDSPYTGAVAGVMLAMSWKMESVPPAYSIEEQMPRYKVFQWTWIGQDPAAAEQRIIPDDTYGSVIYDSSGRVMGFFHDYIDDGPWKGFYASLSADEVVRAGRRLANSSGEDLIPKAKI